MSRFGLVVLMALGAAGPSGAASWADGLFDELSKDFGSVPRGPVLTHSFRLVNKTAAPVHIAGVRVSCGCLTAVPLQYDLAPGQSSAIQVQMDTRRFVGSKNVTIYVRFDRPAWEEVRLWVQANGRDDLTVTPATLALGKAKRGSAPSASVTVTLLGNAQWQIEEVQRESNYVQATLHEVSRQASEVTYQVTATLRADAPVGRWYTDLWLKTNNPALARVRVPLTVEIESSLSVSPGTAVFGQVKPGEEAERRVIIRGVQPFRITSIDGTDEQVSVRGNSPDRRPIHVLTVKLKAAEPGELQRTLRIVTDLPEEGEIEFQAQAQVLLPE